MINYCVIKKSQSTYLCLNLIICVYSKSENIFLYILLKFAKNKVEKWNIANNKKKESRSLDCYFNHSKVFFPKSQNIVLPCSILVNGGKFEELKNVAFLVVRLSGWSPPSSSLVVFGLWQVDVDIEIGDEGETSGDRAAMQAAAAIDLRAEAMSSWPMGWNKNEFQFGKICSYW